MTITGGILKMTARRMIFHRDNFIIQMLICLSISEYFYHVIAAADADRITTLPGLNRTLHYKQYSGYLQSTGDKKLHYWFAESQKSPMSDPLVLWLNGGPGCSSLDGFLYELGPLHVHDDGRTIYENNNTWNLVSNLLFLESPAGVGFSYSDSSNYTFDDNIVADDNFQALKSFFTKFPEFSSNPLYITGESYGGIYIPTLALLVSKDVNMNLKGFAVGNGASSWPLNAQSLPYFAYYHALIGNRLWNTLLSECCQGPRDVNCNFYNNTKSTCQAAMGELEHIMYDIGLNEYGLYTDCSGSRDQYRQLMSMILPRSKYNDNNYKHEGGRVAVPSDVTNTNVDMDPPCINVTAVSVWLNTGAVRQALHIPDKVQSWQVCSEEVSSRYKRLYQDMTDHYHKLLSPSRKLRAMVYNGDTDMACNFLMDQWFVESLDYKVVEEWKPWHLNGQVTGFTKLFDHLRFVTIKGAGHMVPQWKPGPALKMISSFLYNKPL